jgi:hypothetical protein
MRVTAYKQRTGTAEDSHSVWDTLGPMRCLAKDRRGGVALAVVALSLTTLSLCHESSAQSVAVGNCKPVSERTTEVGCWIVAHQPVGQLTTQTFWYLDVYPTRAAAEAAKGPRGTVVESLGRVWLLTIEKAGWRPSKGERIAEIGPLPVAAGEEYSAQYMEAILNPGMTSSIHARGSGSLVHVGGRNVLHGCGRVPHPSLFEGGISTVVSRL